MQLVPDIQERLSSLPETVIDYDRSLLNAEDQKVVAKLIEAARPIHDIFLRQVSGNNPALRTELVALVNKSAFDRRGLIYFDLMMGPWDRLQHDAAFHFALWRRRCQARRRRLLSSGYDGGGV